MPRPDKVAAVEEISGRFKDADAALLTEYRGLRVGEIAEVRDALRGADADYKVLKNTLARIAVREIGLEDLAALLEGPTAVAFIKGDAAAAAKALDEVAKKYPVLIVKGGILGGKVISAEQAGELASLQPREVQLATIAGLFNSPAQNTVNVLSALLRNLGSMLAQVLDRKGEEAPEPPTETPEAETPPEAQAAAPEVETAAPEVQEAAPEAQDAAPEVEAAGPEDVPTATEEEITPAPAGDGAEEEE